MKSKNKMFPFITKTYNPLGGECPYNCIYCWARALCKRFHYKKYQGKLRIFERMCRKKFESDNFIFLCDMLDAFAEGWNWQSIIAILEIPRNNLDSKFLLETKNPERYFDFLKDFPENVILGVTIESDRFYYYDTPSEYKVYEDISKAVNPFYRLFQAILLRNETELPIFLSLEPILIFSERFGELIKKVHPWAVAIGYDNYDNRLPEPKLEKTKRLITELEEMGIKVYQKTIRKAWYES